MVELRKITLEELKQYDGKSCKPAYIAFNGKVYDVIDNHLWGDGEHFGEHKAGLNISGGLANAPHGDEKFGAMVLIGKLIN